MNLFSTGPDPTAEQILMEAIEEHKPTHIFGLFSGGNDSRVACQLASKLPGFTGMFHANTGIGVEATRQYVRDTCKENGWPLHEIKSPKTYAWFVENFGFPGPAMHSIIYSYLKERCVLELVRRHKASRFDRIMLVSGVRQEESQRRMGYDNPISRRGAQVWVNPCHYWSTAKRDAYLVAEKITRNPVAARLGFSGECCCMAIQARKQGRTPESELERIGEIAPEVPVEIARPTLLAKANGKHSRWGHPPPDTQDAELREMLEMHGQTFMPMCSSCVFTKSESQEI